MTDPAVDAAVRALRAGELVAMPTETVYGLAADAGNSVAVAAVYRLKQRPVGHPLIVHVSSLQQARLWAEFSPQALILAERFWPGPLTLIASRKSTVPDFACAGHATVGLRVPSHPVAQALLRQFEASGGTGVAAPSANRFGQISPTRAEHVRDDYGSDAPLVLEGGASAVGLESTICDVSSSSPAVLRPGAITAGDIAAALGLHSLSGADHTRPAAPGTLAAHYAPRTAMELIMAADLAASLLSASTANLRVAVYARDCPRGLDRQQWIQMPRQAGELARCLYDDLRRLDALHADRLFVEQPPVDTEYSAILDRLGRARTGSQSILQRS